MFWGRSVTTGWEKNYYEDKGHWLTLNLDNKCFGGFILAEVEYQYAGISVALLLPVMLGFSGEHWRYL
jgi:hypothetical protein